jgi:hypothetical protein
VAGRRQRANRQNWLNLIVRITVKCDARYVFGAFADPSDLLDYFLSIVPGTEQMYAIDRQLALLKFSIEAGILLCGNGVSRHVGCTHARTHARLQSPK